MGRPVPSLDHAALDPTQMLGAIRALTEQVPQTRLGVRTVTVEPLERRLFAKGPITARHGARSVHRARHAGSQSRPVNLHRWRIDLAPPRSPIPSQTPAQIRASPHAPPRRQSLSPPALYGSGATVSVVTTISARWFDRLPCRSREELARSGAYVVGVDISLGMLAVGRRTRPKVPLVAGDALALPFPDETFDAVTTSFVIRNVANTPAALRELARVTKPGGRMVICEFSHPTNGPFRKVYLHPSSHAGYYPGSASMHLKLLFAPDDGRILGAQIVGYEGVDKRLDVLATAIRAGRSEEVPEWS